MENLRLLNCSFNAREFIRNDFDDVDKAHLSSAIWLIALGECILSRERHIHRDGQPELILDNLMAAHKILSSHYPEMLVNGYLTDLEWAKNYIDAFPAGRPDLIITDGMRELRSASFAVMRKIAN